MPNIAQTGTNSLGNLTKFYYLVSIDKLNIMASFKDSFFSKLSGKIGPVTTYVLNGKQVVRTNTIPHDPKTPKQLAHRMKFALVNKGLSPLNRSIKLGHRGDAYAYRSLVGKAYREAIIGEYPYFALDYSMIKIAEGDLQLPTNILFELDAENNSVILSWEKQIAASKGPAKDNDQINIVAYNIKENNAHSFSGIAVRSDGKASISLPRVWNSEDMHIWVYFSSFSLQMNSESLYCC
jgi:hypothetical protein